MGMFFTYSVSVISTIEKRFDLNSKQTGIILLDECAYIFRTPAFDNILFLQISGTKTDAEIRVSTQIFMLY